MDSRAKQRLTGAVILVALFVLLVPELLTGPKDSAVAPTSPEEEGLRRYTIDLDAPPGAATTATPDAAVNLPPVAQSPLNQAPAAPASGSGNVLAQPGESAQPETPAPQSVAPRAPTATNPVPTPSASQAASRPASAATPAPAATPLPTPATAPSPSRADSRKPAPASASGTFVVQLGSFSSRENAERLVRDMTGKGFATFIAPITTNGRELYRVRVGPTRDRSSAEALAAQLKRIGQSGSIVPIS
jgi:DedD protein